MKTFKLAERISEDIRSRSNSKIIRDYIAENANERIVLDFSNVRFISRSFADEVCQIMDDYKNVSFANTQTDVERMLSIVMLNRHRQRVYDEDKTDIVNVETMEELSNVLSTF